MTTALGDLFRIKHGYAFKGQFFAESGPYVVLTPGNFREEGGFRQKEPNEKYYTGEFPRSFILTRGDLIVAMTEQAEGLLGAAALIPEDDRYLHNQRLGLIQELDWQRLDKKYLYYLFNSRNVRDQIRATANGAKVRHTSPSRIYDVSIDLPPLPIQRKIAAILSPYDDLLENNTRRIAILERMARLLFREWFVEFRFPGHQSARMVDSRLGPIPEDWLAVPIGELVIVWRDNVNPRRMPEVAVDHYSFKAFDEGQLPIAENGAAIQSGKLRMPGECVLLAKLNPRIQRVWHAIPIGERQPVASGEFLVMTPRQENGIPFIFELCSSQDFLARYASLSIGTSGSHQRVKASDALNLLVVLPSRSVVAKFCEIVGPMLSLIYLLRRTGRRLKQTRDLLLPLLVSGELDLEDLDILVEDAAA